MIGDPTAWWDGVAAEMRDHYEQNKPRWWEWNKKSWRYAADNVMLGCLAIALRRADERRKYYASTNEPVQGPHISEDLPHGKGTE